MRRGGDMGDTRTMRLVRGNDRLKLRLTLARIGLPPGWAFGKQPGCVAIEHMPSPGMSCHAVAGSISNRERFVAVFQKERFPYGDRLPIKYVGRGWRERMAKDMIEQANALTSADG